MRGEGIVHEYYDTFMRAGRVLCSELVRLRTDTVESIVNLEAIWTHGATVESETPLEEGTAVEMRAGNVYFRGTVAETERHDFGWRLELEFSPLTPWSPERFRPEHMLDLSECGDE